MERAIKYFKGRIKWLLAKIGLSYEGRKRLPRNSLLGLNQIPFNIIIDVGANKGQFANSFSIFFPEAMIFSFEPLEEPFKYLSRLAKKTPNITPVNAAIGDTDDELEMNWHTNHSASSSLLNTTDIVENHYPETKNQSKINVPVKKLDTAINELNISLKKPILIKLDVQGYENRVIIGGQNTFKLADAVIMEVMLKTLYEGQANFMELCSMMNNLGLKYAGNLHQVYSGNGEVLYIDAVFVRNQ